MAAEFPTSIHDTPLDDISLVTLRTKKLNDATYDHPAEHVSHTEEIIATQTKIGTGSSTPVDGSILNGTGTGTSAWQTNADISGSLLIGTTGTAAVKLEVNSGTGNIAAHFKSTDSTSSIALIDDTTTSTYVRLQALGNDMQFVAGNVIYSKLTSAGVFEVYDTSVADKFTIQHDGSNGLITTNAGDLYVTPAGGSFDLRTGTDVVVWDTANTDNVTIQHDGSNGIISTNVGQINLSPSSNVVVTSGATFVVRDSTDADTFNFSHDGTDAIITTGGAGGGDLKITPAGGDVRFTTGTTLVLLDSANTDTLTLQHDGSNGIISTNTGKIKLEANSYTECGTNFHPETTNSYDLGSGSLEWQDIFLVNSPTVSSDARYKENIEDTKFGLYDVLQLRPVSYTWKEGKEGVHQGYIAQEVEEVVSGKDFAGLVYDEGVDKYSLRYTEFLPMHTKAIQELYAMIKELQDEIRHLKNNE